MGTSRRRAKQDRGSLGTQAAIVMPVIFALLLTLVHYAYLAGASQTMDDAANEAARALMLPGATQQDAQEAAGTILNADTTITSWTVTQIDADTVRIQGTGTQIMPFAPVTVVRDVDYRTVSFLNEEDR